MIDTIDALSRLLESTPLAGRQLAELAVLDSGELAFAVRIGPDELETAWRSARGLLEATGRWPVAVSIPATCASWQASLVDADLFNRFFFEEAENTADISPQGVLAAAAKADVPAFLERLAGMQAADGPLEQDEIEEALANTRNSCGSAPELAEVSEALSSGSTDSDRYRLEQMLLAWEAAHCDASAQPADTAYQQWMQGEGYPSALLFLPTPHPWDALAYLHYFGASPMGSEYYIALGRIWQQRFGAELVAHYGTMLQVVTSRRPVTPESALQLAREHDLAALDTLSRPGVSLRDHARYLLAHDRWFLHQRP
jgi:hypothetical protein